MQNSLEELGVSMPSLLYLIVLMVSCDKAFVYGTLLADEVVNAILKRVPIWKPAVLRGYRRYGVKHAVYPAIIPSTLDYSVKGQVLIGLSDLELKYLDEYESDEYFRDLVQVQINGEQELTDAYVYVWKSDLQYKLDGNSWDYDMFRQRHFKQYLQDSQEWAEEIHSMVLQ
eukprot:TRINITY_DN3469_c0_g1_i3.p2 TRINITY_DN3469_c0_g1~~TRINITY_DN3469_c0_g1_i3.p2  ORF type:complete len:171 (-),score=16.52 TRINITY_DN3469_c0_g1_i3:419-931(-)